MSEIAEIYDAGETAGRWQIIFRREDGGTGNFTLDKPLFRKRY